MSTINNTLKLENTTIGFRNFAGNQDQYNKTGVRGFAVFLTYEQADELSALGWNVKYPKENPAIPADEDRRKPYLQVAFSLEMFPPKILLFHNGTPTYVDETNIDSLDWVQIETCDIVLRAHHWNVNGKSGIKAYLKSLYITVATDEFYDKYGV